MGGISTNHEAVDYDMALAQRRRGMHIHVRQGSAARNLDAIVSGLVAAGGNADGFSFCTDDKHIEDIQREGHINCCVRRAIELGLDPVQAVRMATINTARCYGLRHLGAIAPGYQADLVVVDDLRRMGVELVFHRGQRVTFPLAGNVAGGARTAATQCPSGAGAARDVSPVWPTEPARSGHPHAAGRNPDQTGVAENPPPRWPPLPGRGPAHHRRGRAAPCHR